MDLSLSDFEPFIERERIAERIAELGAQIRADYAGRELVVVGVLKGSFLFMADLVRELGENVTCDFLRCSSYEGVRSTGKVRIEFDLTQPIEGKDVLIVEDIIDTGLTMNFLLQALGVRGASSLKVCSLLDKPSRRKSEVPIDYVGFSIEDRFVIGYGLDLDGRYRNLSSILALSAEAAARIGA
jgi:hypoxanthine phosphoribosyltransferase